MHSEYSREKIANQLRSEWLGEARQEMKDLFSADAQRMDEILKNALEAIQEGQAEKALNSITEKLKQFLPQNPDEEKQEEKADYESPIIVKIREITTSIPEKVVLDQEEERFSTSEPDSIFIKGGRLIKRTARGIQGGLTATGNIFRKIWNGSEKPKPIWKQTVPLRNITELNLMALSDWRQVWNDELKILEAEVLLEADAWMLHSTGLVKYYDEQEEREAKKSVEKPKNVPNQADIETFFQEAIKQLNDLQELQTKKLDELFEKITRDIEEGIALTGTFERSGNEYSASEISRKENNIVGREQISEAAWDELQNALVNRVHLSMGFNNLYRQVQERVTGFSESIEEFFTENIEDPQQDLMEQLEEAIGFFDGSGDKSLKEVREISNSYREKMKEHMDQQLLNPILEFTSEAVLSTKFDRFTSAIPDWTKNLPEHAILVEKLDLATTPPKYEFEEVDWQVLVQRVINNHLAKEFAPKEIKAEQFLKEIGEGFQEISQIIYTNLEIADEVKKSDEEEPLEVACEGLKRAKAKLLEISERVKNKRKELVSKLGKKQDTAFTKLAMLLEKQDVSEVRLAGAEYKAKETAIDWKTKLQVLRARLEDKTELFGRFTWKKSKEYFEAIRKLLGFAKKEKLEGDKTDLATFLSETDEQIASLPFIYRHLFDFNKEVEDRFYIRRPEQFDRFKKGYELWQNNFPSTFAIIGEKGSGKSLFIRLLQGEVLTKHEIIDINFKETIWKPEKVVQKISSALKLDDISTIEDLIEAIGRKKKRVVIILENIQNCYIRNISGFEAIEQLMFLISETNKEVLWINSCTRYGWMYLDKVLNLADYFTHTVQTDNLSAAQIEELILKRHKASGYQLRFIPDEATKKSRNFRKLMDNEEKTQDLLRNQYFEKLSKLSEGNPSIAMIYWIRSIKDYDETHFNIVPFEFGAINRIEELESPELFALAAFVLHDALNPEELARIMHEPLRDSKVMISRLTSRSILFKSDYGFMLNHLIYRQVIRVLKEANFIH